jgi:molybdate transport system ATP-binding protein
VTGFELEAGLRLGELDLDVELAIDGEHRLAIVGLSGAGKSTLLRLAAGLLDPDRGRIRCGGVTWLDTERGVRLLPEQRRCGFLFQHYALFPRMRAWQNVAYGVREGGRAERRDRAREVLRRLGVDHLADAYPPRLSGGERQRVALARALAGEPQLLLLDEPLSALDPRTRSRVAAELLEILTEASVPAIVVTHDFSEAASLGERLAVIDRGRIVQSGTPTEVAAEPASAFVADLTGAVVLTGTARPGEEQTTVELDGGSSVVSLELADGPVAVTVYPWEIELEPAGAAHPGSALNHLVAEVRSVTTVGNRVRVALAAPQLLISEVTAESARRLELRQGKRVVASWKAAATRLVPR